MLRLPVRAWAALCCVIGIAQVATTEPPSSDQCGPKADDGKAARVAIHDHPWPPGLIARLAHQKVVEAVAYSPDSRIVATGSRDCTIRLWDAATGKLLRTLDNKGHYVCSLAFSPDGHTLASGGVRVAVWDPAIGKELREILDISLGFFSLTFSADGKTLAAHGSDWSLRFWDVATGKQLHNCCDDELSRHAQAVCPDGKTVASSGDGGVVWLWDATTGKSVRQIIVPHPEPWRNPLFVLAFSLDGSTLASECGGDGAIRFWDVASGKQLRETEGYVISRPPHSVTSMCFSADGKSLATAGDDGTVRIWEVLTGQERFRLHTTAWVVCLSSDGKTLTTTTREGTAALVWDATGRHRGGQVEVTPLLLKEAESLWADLASADALRAYRAVWALAAAPRQTLPLLKERLRAVPPADPARLERWISDLDSDDFEVREQASKGLERFGGAAKAVLLKARKDWAGPELRRRVEKLLEGLEAVPLPECLQTLRAIEVLEHVAGPEARAVLERLAKGAPGAAETEHARAALARLRRTGSN